jgi:hypothetical protein
MWSLILIVLLNGQPMQPIHIDGFLSESACASAGSRYDAGPGFGARYSCMRVQ